MFLEHSYLHDLADSSEWEGGKFDPARGLLSQGSVGGPLLRREVLEGRSRDSFFETCFCLGWIPALPVENGRIIGLSGVFRSLWFPLGISVEDSVLEIVGLDSKLGLIMGEFAF